MPWAVIQFALLVSAALFFAAGGLCMQLSQGLTRGLPSLGVFACFGAGAACQTLGMQGSPMSSIYVIVLGLEAVAAFLLGAIFLNERWSWERVAALILIVAGIAWLRRSG